MIDDSNGDTNRLSKNNGFTFEPLATNGARFYINKSVSTGAWGNSSGGNASYFYFYYMEIPNSSSPFATYVSNNLNKKFKEFRIYLDNSLIIRFTNPNGLTITGTDFSSYNPSARFRISGSYDINRYNNGGKVSDITSVGGSLNGRYYYIALFKEMNGANE